jgi:hypothetical protein
VSLVRLITLALLIILSTLCKIFWEDNYNSIFHSKSFNLQIIYQIFLYFHFFLHLVLIKHSIQNLKTFSIIIYFSNITSLSINIYLMEFLDDLKNYLRILFHFLIFFLKIYMMYILFILFYFCKFIMMNWMLWFMNFLT